MPNIRLTRRCRALAPFIAIVVLSFVEFRGPVLIAVALIPIPTAYRLLRRYEFSMLQGLSGFAPFSETL